jgi:PST family polysaccharide transporter
VAQAVATSLTSLGLIWLLCDWRPIFAFRWRAIRELAGMGTGHLFGSVVSYWVRTVDNVLIGYHLGQTPLGIYSRAYSVMLFPWSRVTQVISRVMFPSFSLIQKDPARVRALFMRVNRLIALVTFPMMLGVFACAENFVACVFGPQWGEMIPILRILALVGMLNSIASLYYEIYLSQGRMDLYLRVSLPAQAFQILGIVVGLKWGIVGVSVGYAATTLLITPITCHFAGGLIGMTAVDFFKNLSSLFACAVVMALGVALLGAVFTAGGSPWPKLALQVLCGAALYAGQLQVFSVAGWVEFLDEAGRRLAAWRKPS